MAEAREHPPGGARASRLLQGHSSSLHVARYRVVFPRFDTYAPSSGVKDQNVDVHGESSVGTLQATIPIDRFGFHTALLESRRGNVLVGG